MQIKHMFEKNINRDIKGVVKVGQDDAQNIYQELEEYVVTNELLKHIGEFFHAYKKGTLGPTDEIGVWLSGFFGSGKSHFLKILSYLVENKEVHGKKAISFFHDKIQDPMILADLKMAGDITTDVILFDIDAKNESDSKNEKDAIVKVLNKVFNEMQGFCGSIPWIADLERQMLKDGVYDDFKRVFEECSGREWLEAREDFYYEEDAIIEALVQTTKMSEEAARNWYQRAEQDYSISIETFAKRVKEYIDAKGKNHHVAFFIDEVGQYIGDNSNLMLNLQTIVHQLGIFCHGQAWIIVTSQEDIDSVIKVTGNDFSKIQGRFDTKLSLSSAFVDEVIKKRILVKNETARQTLEEVYGKKGSILKNLITFSHSAEMKTFTDEQDFIEVYPFVPYQFNLLQKVFTGVRIHGASGKHLAEGERSLLSAFQESAIRYAEKEEGALVPFSAFYETIEAFLDSSIRSVIIHAKKNSRLTEYDVELLKLLFLIKYVKEIPSNLENLSTLMVDHIDVGKLELKKQIEGSLSRLVRETLIQKNGEEYVFLTNDEQDVNREIKNMHVDSAEIILKVGDEIFSAIYTDKKYRHSTKYHFSFNTIIDERPIGTQTHEIGLKVITPYLDASMDLNQAQLRSMSIRENSVIVRLPQDTSYLDEMEEILKIQAYLRVKSGTSVSQAIEDIKTRKSREVAERKERVRTQLIEALKAAELYVGGQLLDIKEKNPIERINDAFSTLVNTIYNKLTYVKVFVDSAKDLHNILMSNTTQLSLDEEEEQNKLALDEVNKYIQRLTERKQSLTVKGLTTYFSKQPYGWNDLDIVALLIKLFKSQEIKLQLNSAYVTTADKNLIDYVTKRDYVDRVIVKMRERISASLLKNVKDICNELFGVKALPADEDGLMNKCKDLLRGEKGTIDMLLSHYRPSAYYPGQKVLEGGKAAIEALLSISDTASFYNKAKVVIDDLLDYAEDVAKVKGFFENQRDKFDDGLKRLEIFEKNKSYVTDSAVQDVIGSIEKIIKQSKPYGLIQKLPDLCREFDDVFIVLLEKECEPIRAIIDADYRVVVEELAQHEQLKEKLSLRFKSRFDDLKERLEQVNNFYEAIAMQTESDRLKVRCMNDIESELRLVPPPKPPVTTGGGTTTIGTGGTAVVDGTTGYKTTKTLSKATLLRGTKVIENEADIDSFVEELRKKLQQELADNTIIKLV